MNSKSDYVLRQGQTRSHICHWPKCGKQLAPALYMCKWHWFSLPQWIRHKIWRAYRPGQENDMRPSPEYLAVANEAQQWIKDNKVLTNGGQTSII